MNLSCYIIDDEFHAVNLLTKHIAATNGLTLLGHATNPLTGLNEVTGERSPDILFLDIEMPELSGMELAGLTRPSTAIVFTTAFREFAPEAFDQEAADFLLKPISYARFLKAVQRVQRTAQPKPAARDFFFVKSEIKGRMVKVIINDIIYVEGAQNYIKLHVTSGTIMPYLTLTEIENYLPAQQFSRIHQSFIINNDHIKVVEQGRVILQEGTSLNLGRSYKDAFLEKMKATLLRTGRQP